MIGVLSPRGWQFGVLLTPNLFLVMWSVLLLGVFGDLGPGRVRTIDPVGRGVSLLKYTRPVGFSSILLLKAIGKWDEVGRWALFCKGLEVKRASSICYSGFRVDGTIPQRFIETPI